MRTWTTRGALAALAALAASPATAQQDPASIGAGQLPYVLIVMDTSGSMESTTAGDEVFPAYGVNAGVHRAQWKSDGSEFMNVAEKGSVGDARLPGPESFGPCYVWEHPVCSRYERPPWSTAAPGSWLDSVPSTELMSVRMGKMRGLDLASTPKRLNTVNQPRHVILKEILTGDMVLRTSDKAGVPVSELPASDYGPGCWFVPRQRGQSSNLNPQDTTICDVTGEIYTSVPDYAEPRPHFQEVWDGQVRNGLLDSLSSTAIFAVAMFDGYNEDLDGTDKSGVVWPDKLNDSFAGTRPGARPGEEGAAAGSGLGSYYDLGVYKVVGPKTLQIPGGKLGQLSTFAQLTLLDAGYLSPKSAGQAWELRPDSTMPYWTGASFDDDLANYLDPYQFGRQPMAKATPLAAAVHDVNQFMRYGYDATTNNPVYNDEFGECRQKHVVLLTDGYPEPEVGTGIGSDRLNLAHGYEPSLYSYDTTEEEISALVTNTEIPGNNTENYKVKVHVVGLNLEGDFQAIRDKLSGMARAGGTCVRAEDSAGNRIYGLSDAWTDCNSGGCLVTGQTPYPFQLPGTVPVQFVDCQYPALILQNNEPEMLQKALTELFQTVVGSAGITSRTRTVVTDYLDNVSTSADFASASDVVGGQYRFYSGIEIGGSPYWRGILNRQLLPCGDDPTKVVWTAFHDQIASQVVQTSNSFTDNRRVFTSLPHGNLVEYSNTYVGSRVKPIPLSNTGPFFFTYDLMDTPTSADEFGGTYINSSGAEINAVVGTRIPFESAQLTAAIGTGNVYDYMVVGGGSSSERELTLREVIDLYRGRSEEKADRVLGGILNGNPVVVTPPDLDLPIGSYRQFRARFGDRPTMLYVPTVDGQLHAIHSGVLRGRLAIRAQRGADDGRADTKATTTQSADDQREAWSFIPNMILRRLASAVGSQPYFLDATPSVKDVRLCQAMTANNQNKQACVEVCGGAATCEANLQWRSVLVQGLGTAGSGYFALDVTRPGGFEPVAAGGDPYRKPDPIALWEFDREWERVQVEYLATKNPSAVLPASQTIATTVPAACYDSDGDGVADRSEAQATGAFWKAPMLGLSVSDPEIATLQVTVGKSRQQRPVAVFGGGSIDSNTGGTCGASAAGQAIYVVDLQTGSLLRRFVEYEDPDASYPDGRFAAVDGTTDEEPIQFVGSPALYDAFPGSVATRGFIGDNRGRLFRMDFRDPNPANWSVSLFFDPARSTEIANLRDDVSNDSTLNPNNVDLAARKFGPAAFKPAIALTDERDFVILYGLGEKTDINPQRENQAVIALRESGVDFNSAQLEWGYVFQPGEKLTGEPLIFDRAAYFPTYAVPSEDSCTPGSARIYTVGYVCPSIGCNATRPLPEGLVTLKTEVTSTDTGVVVDSNNRWFGPEEKTVIRGLTLTLNRSCSLTGAGTDDPIFNDSSEPQPQLIAQTGSVDAGADYTNADLGSGTANNPNASDIKRMVVDIQPPRSQLVPLGWSIVSN